MKAKKALLAENLILKKAIKTLQAKARNLMRTGNTDGSLTVNILITAAAMKQMPGCVG
jgi:hypothetical protein